MSRSAHKQRWYTVLTFAIRFVDRDMFMHYRGGGIGHRYMREIEKKYENMSLERIHGNRNRKPSQNNADASASGPKPPDPPGEDEDEMDNENEGGLDNRGKSTSGNSGGGELDNGGGGESAGDESDDGDYVAPETGDESDDDPDDDRFADSDEIESDGGHESYGLADF